MIGRPWLLLLILPLLVAVDVLQSKNRAIEEGNARLKAGKAEEALGYYDKAVAALPSDPGAHFNRGNALYGLSRFEEAAQEFLRATEAKIPGLKAQAFYNLGNSFFKGNKFGEAIEAYKRSLQLDPADVRAKWNLEIALKKKQEEEEKKKREEERDKDKKEQDKDKQSKKDDKQDKQSQGDDKKGDDKKDDDKKDDQQAKPDQPKPDQPKPDQAQGGPDKAKPEPPKPTELQQIDAVLDNLEQSPKALEKERARLRAVRRSPPQKDW
jgi:tetratricopeptide (TPR) repeat protein